MKELIEELHLLVAASINTHPSRFRLKLEISEKDHPSSDHETGWCVKVTATEARFEGDELASWETNPNLPKLNAEYALKNLMNEIRKGITTPKV